MIQTIRTGSAPAGMALDPANGDLYVPNLDSGNISVVNASTGAVVGVVSGLSYPEDATYDPSNGMLYVTEYYSENLAFVDTSSNTLVTNLLLNGEPIGVGYDSSNGNIYVAETSSSQVLVYSPASGTIIATPSVGGDPVGVAPDPFNGEVYVTNEEDGTVSVINGTTNLVTDTIPGFSEPFGVVADPQTGNVYVANAATENVSEIDGQTNAILGSAKVGSYPQGLSFDPASEDLYVANYLSSNVTVLSASTRAQVGTIAVGSEPIYTLYDPSNGYVLASNLGSNNVSVISTRLALSSTEAEVRGTVGPGGEIGTLAVPGGAGVSIFATMCDAELGQIVALGGSGASFISAVTDTVEATLPVGSDPTAAACDPSNGEVLVTNPSSGNVSILSELTDTVLGSVYVGGYPLRALFDPATGNFYVSNDNDANVDVISAATNVLLGTIPTSTSPGNMVLDTGNGEIYVADQSASSVTAISPSTDSALATISVGYTPEALAYDNQYGNIYVNGYDQSTSTYEVTVISGATNTVVTSVYTDFEPDDLVADPDNGDVYIVNLGASNVQVLDGATNAIVQVIGVGLDPQGAVLDPVNGDLYVPNGFSPNVSVIDTATNTVVSSFGVPSDPYPYEAVYDDRNGQVYVALSYTNSVTAISTWGHVTSPTTPALDVGQTLRLDTPVLGPGAGLSQATVTVFPNASLSCQEGGLGHAFLSATCLALAPGTYWVNESTTDDLGQAVFSNISVSVNPGPTISKVTLPTSADLGQSISLSAAPTGGSGSYPSFSWVVTSKLNCTISNQSTLTCVPDVPGMYNVSVAVNVTDSFNSTSPTYAETSFEVVSSHLGPVTLSASRASLDDGQSTTLTVDGSGGSQGYSYLWSGLPSGCVSLGPNAQYCEPTGYLGLTNVEVHVKVNDSNGASGAASLNLTISQDPGLTIPTATNEYIEIGASTTLSVTARNFTDAASTYSWSGLPTGCPSVDALTLTCAPRISGNFTPFADSVTAWITDANGVKVQSGALVLQIAPALRISSLTASRATLDVGQTISFQVSAYGGSGSASGQYNYTWQNYFSGCSRPYQASMTCIPTFPPSNATHAESVVVTDSYGYAVASSTVNFTVVADPSVTPPTASRTSLDLEQSTYLSVTITHATGTYATIDWFGLPTGCSSVNATALTCAPTGRGTFVVWVDETDSNLDTVTSGTLILTVYHALTVPSLSASRSSLDEGQTVELTVTASYGLAPYSYVWHGLPTDCFTANVSTLLCTSNTTGTFAPDVAVTDAEGELDLSPTVSLELYADPAIQNLTASPPRLDVGQNTTFTGSLTYASGLTIAYAWLGLPTNCTGLDTATVLCGPAAGTYLVTLTVTDSNGFSVTSAPMVLLVSPALGAPTFYAEARGTVLYSNFSVDVGQSYTLYASGNGGEGVYYFSWNGVYNGTEPACSYNSGDSTAFCTPLGPGNTSVAVLVGDANGEDVWSYALSITIYGQLGPGNVSSPPTLLDLGQPYRVQLVVVGGSGGLMTTWSGLPPGCAVTSSSYLDCRPRAAGEYMIGASLTDSDGETVNFGPFPLVVSSPLSTPTVDVLSTQITLGGSLVLTAYDSGGSAPYNYTWSGLPTGCPAPIFASLACVPTQIGDFYVFVTVTDAVGDKVSSAPVNVTVTPSSPAPPPATGLNGLEWDLIALCVGLGILVAGLVILVLRAGARGGARSTSPAPAPKKSEVSESVVEKEEEDELLPQPSRRPRT